MTDHTTPTNHIAGGGAYNPYSGKETLDILMKRIYNQLRGHQDFANHLSYTKFAIDFTVTLKAEALVPTVIKGKESYELRPKDANFTVSVTSEPAPDTMRQEAGLPIPRPQVTTGGMADFTIQQQMPPL